MAFNSDRHFRLGVVIVNYKTPDLVVSCLNSLVPMLDEADAAVAVVDNSSGDGSFEKLQAYCEKSPENARLNVIAAPDNGGFSAGNNIGLSAVSSDLVLFLNSDAIARQGALMALLEAAKSNSRAGIFTPTICNSAGKIEVSRFRNISPLSEFIDGAQTGPVTKLFPKAEVPIFPDNVSTQPDWVSFAAVMIRREAIEKAGAMDEGFFLYFEDCDYCRRIVKEGFDIALAAEAVFQHDAGGSTQLRRRSDRGERIPSYYYESRSRYFRKYYGPLGPILANIAWYAGRLIAKLRGLFGRPAPSVSKGRAQDIWINWRGAVRKR